ncbi:STAS domain-containing protein [Catelliglobosispora koreensis]|uniref:STAS domain-containing protein n=1 Tax=Catelliglobosispora koreensis TaxID=129052 RepID=UPI0012FC9D00|nr:STAS domain-containing protein [Catelliglobosispora koreensis]
MRSFSVNKRCVGGSSVRLELAGDVRGVAAEQLTPMILEAIVAGWADELHVDLDAVTYLDGAGVLALVCGYVAAVECGSAYRVVNARGQAQRTLEATGVVEMLADSEDLGALVLALLSRPPRKH